MWLTCTSNGRLFVQHRNVQNGEEALGDVQAHRQQMEQLFLGGPGVVGGDVRSFSIRHHPGAHVRSALHPMFSRKAEDLPILCPAVSTAKSYISLHSRPCPRTGPGEPWDLSVVEREDLRRLAQEWSQLFAAVVRCLRRARRGPLAVRANPERHVAKELGLPEEAVRSLSDVPKKIVRHNNIPVPLSSRVECPPHMAK